MKVKETDISRGIKEYLTALGLFVERNNVGKIQTVRKSWMVLHREGFPDLSVYMPGPRTVFIEVKIPGEKPLPKQLEIHTQLRDLGFEVLVVQSVQEVVDWLETTPEPGV